MEEIFTYFTYLKNAMLKFSQLYEGLIQHED